jgi:XK-related protein.
LLCDYNLYVICFYLYLIPVSRILSISAVAALSSVYTVVACAVHWVIMTVWLSVLDRTNFCTASPDGATKKEHAGEILFAATLGLVYIFTYITPSEGRTRTRYSVYYVVCFIENLVSAVAWASKASPEVQNTWYFLPLLIFSIVPFIVGIVFMILYYLYCHPKGISPVIPVELPTYHTESHVSLAQDKDTSETQG